MPKTLVLVATDRDLARVRKILDAYEAYLREHHPNASLKGEQASLPGPYAVPDGRLFLITNEREVAGCAAFRRLEEGICEMRRLYVMPSHRRRGLGRRAAIALKQEARRIGYVKMRLLTLPFMREADALYRSVGFREIPPYRPTTAHDAVFMEVNLAQDASVPNNPSNPTRDFRPPPC